MNKLFKSSRLLLIICITAFLVFLYLGQYWLAAFVVFGFVVAAIFIGAKTGNRFAENAVYEHLLDVRENSEENILRFLKDRYKHIDPDTVQVMFSESLNSLEKSGKITVSGNVVKLNET